MQDKIMSSTYVPWNLRNHWNNSMMLISNIIFLSHIFREGYQRANDLANINLLPFLWLLEIVL